MKITRSRLIEIIVVLLVISYPIASEIIYHRDISPSGRGEFHQFTGMLHESASVRVFEAESGMLMKFTGLGPRRGLLAVPSAAPQYYFDESGTYQGWVRDPGDMKTPERFSAVGAAELIPFDEAVNRIEARKTAGHNKSASSSPNPLRVD